MDGSKLWRYHKRLRLKTSQETIGHLGLWFPPRVRQLRAWRRDSLSSCGPTKLPRLLGPKHKWDPKNVFSFNNAPTTPLLKWESVTKSGILDGLNSIVFPVFSSNHDLLTQLLSHRDLLDINSAEAAHAWWFFYSYHSIWNTTCFFFHPRI